METRTVEVTVFSQVGGANATFTVTITPITKKAGAGKTAPVLLSVMYAFGIIGVFGSGVDIQRFRKFPQQLYQIVMGRG